MIHFQPSRLRTRLPLRLKRPARPLVREYLSNDDCCEVLKRYGTPPDDGFSMGPWNLDTPKGQLRCDEILGRDAFRFYRLVPAKQWGIR